MRKSILVTALAGVLVWAGVASAGPLNPSLATDVNGDFTGAGNTLCGGLSCIAGEGAAPNFQRDQTVDGVLIGPGAVQHIDWIIIHDAAGTLAGTNGSAAATNDDYLFMYQIENSSVFRLSTLLIAGHANTTGSLTADFGFKAGTEGFLSGKDLDLNADTPGGVGHTGTANGGAFSNLGDSTAAHAPFPAVNESERTGAGAALTCCQDPESVTVASLFVNFGPPAPVFGPTAFLEVGEESSILFVRGTVPVYGNFVTSGVGADGTPVAWGSSNQQHCSDPPCSPAFAADELGVQIPIPGQIPEPASLLLLGSGLAGLGILARRRKN